MSMANKTAVSDEPVMQTIDVFKQYPGTLALNGVNFNVRRGKVNALIGENGAGKSTLMKICAGIEQPSKGELLLNSQKIDPHNTREATALGIGMIHQELNFFADMTVAENMFAGKEISKFGLLNAKEQLKYASEALKNLQQDILPTEMMYNLRVGQQQIVEIAKATLGQELHVLIMDEPTSSLSNTEVEVLFELINGLKQKGIAIIYISHRLEEIMRISDYVTVLRDGSKVAESETKKIDIPWIVKSMVGSKVTHIDKVPYAGESVNLMRLEGIRLSKMGGGMLVDDVDLSLNSGEVLGIYGLMGSGRTELIECIMGLHPQCKGEFTFFGKRTFPKSVASQIKRGLAQIPEDRQKYGLVQTMSIEDNLILMSEKKQTKFGFLRKSIIRNNVDSMVKKLFIKIANPKKLVTSLSGGNQQKVVIGKALLSMPKIILFDEPSRGIDIGAKSDVFRIMRQFVSEGIGVIFVGSELKEILSVCDRVVVMSRGKIVGEFSGDEMTEESLILATGEGIKQGVSRNE